MSFDIVPRFPDPNGFDPVGVMIPVFHFLLRRKRLHHAKRRSPFLGKGWPDVVSGFGRDRTQLIFNGVGLRHVKMFQVGTTSSECCSRANRFSIVPIVLPAGSAT